MLQSVESEFTDSRDSPTCPSDNRSTKTKKRRGLGGSICYWPDENRITRRKARTSATIKHEKMDVYLSNAPPNAERALLCVGSEALPFLFCY